MARYDGTEYRTIPIASGFPPSLNTATPASDIGQNETPDGYGYDITQDGVVRKGAIPNGTTRVSSTGNIAAWVTSTAYQYHHLASNGGNHYLCLEGHTSGTFATDLAAGKWVAVTPIWANNRLILLQGNTLMFGAKGYDDCFVPQRSGNIFFDEDAQPIVTVIPYRPDFVMVLKSTGGYFLSNLTDSRGFFQHSDIIQELACPAANQAVELAGNVYVSNANGLVMFNGATQQISELTRAVRDTVSTYANKALTCDYGKQWVIGAATFAMDVANPQEPRLFRYSGSNFRYTSPQIHQPNYAPLSIDALRFVISHSDTNDAWLKYQIKLENNAWTDVDTLNFNYEAEGYTVKEIPLEDVRQVHKWQLRLTDVSDNLDIKQIAIVSDLNLEGDYSS